MLRIRCNSASSELLRDALSSKGALQSDFEETLGDLRKDAYEVTI